MVKIHKYIEGTCAVDNVFLYIIYIYILSFYVGTKDEGKSVEINGFQGFFNNDKKCMIGYIVF